MGIFVKHRQFYFRVYQIETGIFGMSIYMEHWGRSALTTEIHVVLFYFIFFF